MRNRLVGSILAVAAMFAISPAVLAQTAAPAGAERPTPNLVGVWTHAGQAVDGSPGMGFLWSEEEPAMLPWAAERYKIVRTDARTRGQKGHDDLDSIQYPYCLVHGMPRVWTAPFPFEILQYPDRMYILYESNSAVRRIYTDGRKFPENYPATSMGYSIGRWDGDTLVAETINIRALDGGLLWLDNVGHPRTEALRVVERFRRAAQDTLEITFLFDDPQTYVRPWGGKKVFRLKPDWEIMDNRVCEDLPLADFENKVRGKRP